MSAVVHVVITADSELDFGEAVGELMITLNARYWDADDSPGQASDDTCERVVAWLRGGAP